MRRAETEQIEASLPNVSDIRVDVLDKEEIRPSNLRVSTGRY